MELSAFLVFIRGCPFLSKEQCDELTELAPQIRPSEREMIARDIQESAQKRSEIYDRQTTVMRGVERSAKKASREVVEEKERTEEEKHLPDLNI